MNWYIMNLVSPLYSMDIGDALNLRRAESDKLKAYVNSQFRRYYWHRRLCQLTDEDVTVLTLQLDPHVYLKQIDDEQAEKLRLSA